jgi:hypothetical protein
MPRAVALDPLVRTPRSNIGEVADSSEYLTRLRAARLG